MSWLKSWLGSTTKPTRSRRRGIRRESLEEIESRIVPSFVGPRFEYHHRDLDIVPMVQPGQIYFLAAGPSPDQLRFEAPDSNVNAGDTTNTDTLWNGGGQGLNLTGTGLSVGVWEAGGGRIRNTHQEFGGRGIDGDSGGTLSDHATHVAGTIGAAGVDATARGMATGVTIRGYTSASDTTEMNSIAGSIVASNHSYGLVTGWTFDAASNYGLPAGLGNQWIWLNDRSTNSQEDIEFGRYGQRAVDFDTVLAANPNLLAVTSAGNDRGDFPTAGTTQYVTYFSSDPGNVGGWTGAGWYLAPNSGPTVFPGSDGNNGTGYDTISGDRAIKNGLIIGAINISTNDPLRDSDIVMSSFSGWGPTDDGRVKPDLVAAGVNLYSSIATSNSSYDTLSGTSMSTPNTTGTAVLLAQYYQQQYGALPTSATMRALMTHTARDAGNVGPDYVYGWGVLDANAAINHIRNSKAGTAILQTGTYTGTQQNVTFNAKGGVPLKVTIAWTDPAGTLRSALDDTTPNLVRDIDIYVEGPGGTVYQTWKLNPATPNAAATRASGGSYIAANSNHIDNIEQVLIDAPAAGTYTIRIGHSASSFTQNYSLMVSEGGDRFERNETLATAANLGAAPGINITGVSIHDSTDHDWYKFEVLRSDSLRVKASFPAASGNLDVQFTNAAGTVLASGTTTGDNEQFDVSGLAPGTYYVHVYGAGGVVNFYDLSITPAPGSTTKVYYVNDARYDDGVYALAAGNDANDGLTPQTPKATVTSVLSTYALGPTSLVAIDTGSYGGTTTIAQPDEGAIYAGSPLGSNFNFSGTRFELVDADFNILFGLGFTGSGGTGVYIHPGTVDASVSNRIIQSNFSGTSTAIHLEGGSSNSFESNTISGGGSYGILVNTATSSTSVLNNFISSRTYGFYAYNASSSGIIQGNSISNTSYGLYLVGTSGFSITGNSLSTNTRGLYALNNSTMTITGNTVAGNSIGFEGNATFGGTSWAAGQFNDLNANATGIILNNGGAARFNRVHHGTVGITGASNTSIANNEIFRNSSQGILLDNSNTVSIRSNTIYNPIGDAVRARNFTQNVTLRNNILHVESGYSLSVTNDSQFNLDSDYNNLFSTGTGRPVYFQKEFADLFDWQVESGLDQHSIGTTAPAPALDNPQYVNLAADNYTLGSSSTSIDAGDPASVFTSEPAPNGNRINIGAHGNTALATASPAAYLELNYPNYYTDWEFDESRPIQWRGYNVGGNLSLDLVEEVSGTVRHIADVPVATGSYTWIPSSLAGLSASITARHRIRITSISQPSIVDSSREPFSITLGTTTDFYVNDALTAQDEYATAAGDNRKTGKTPGDPKSSLIALLRSYHLQPGDLVHIDAGNYNHVRNIVISGNLTLGDDEGATFQGATGSNGGETVLDRANPYNSSTNIELSDGDEVTLRNLTLAGANYGLWVHNGSIRFDGFQLTIRNNAQHGLIIEGDSEQTTVDQLKSYSNGGNGINIAAPIGSLLNSQAYSNGQNGIVLSGSLTAVRNIITHDNVSAGLTLTNTNNAVIENVESYNNYYGITVSNNTGKTTLGNADLSLAKGNYVHNNTIGIDLSGSGAYAVGNNIVANKTGLAVNYGSTAERNLISGGVTGVTTYASGTVRQNRIYNNSGLGVSGSSTGTYTHNIIYNNGAGGLYHYSTATIQNNILYNNNNYNILISGNTFDVSNNTIYAPTGDGIQLSATANNSLTNNIIWALGGAAISVASDSQTGFVSDYNLIRATSFGSVGRWQGVLRSNLNAWQNASFTDQNSISQDPLFVDFDGADNMLGYFSAAQDGRDDNFHVQSDVNIGSFPGSLKNGALVPVLGGGTLPVDYTGTWSVDADRSPTLDRGNPSSSYANEPTPNGGYVDLGAYGNTAQTSRSPAQYILTTRPDGGEIWPAAQTFNIRWRADNFGGVSALDFDGGDDYAAIPHNAALARGNAQPLTLEAWIKPDSLGNGARTIISKGRTGGNESSNYTLRAGNGGSFPNRLTFYYRDNASTFHTFMSSADVLSIGVWQHVAVSYTFGTAASAHLYVNGVEVPGTWFTGNGNAVPVSTTDPLWIGAINGINAAPVEEAFDGLIEDVRVWTTTRTPAEIAANINNSLTGSETGLAGYWKFDEASGTAINDSSPTADHGTLAAAPSAPLRAISTAPLSRVDVDLVDGTSGAVVANIVNGTPNDGDVNWLIPESVPPGTNYKVRVRRSDNFTLTDSSNNPFEITAKISFYYVNDASFTDGGDLTSAPGSDANNGLSPSTPKASIRSVLDTYDLGPGDVIIVDAGSYTPTSNILVTSNDTGVTIRGNALNKPTLNRGNTSNGAAVFEVSGADDVTIEDLTATGGYYGVYVPSASGTDRLTVRRTKLTANSNYGFYAYNGNTAIRLEDSIVSANYYGLYFYGIPDARVLNCDIFNNTYHGAVLDGAGLSAATPMRIEGSRVRGNTYAGIEADNFTTAANNLIWNNQNGISANYGSFQITGNKIWSNTNYGITTYGGNDTSLILDNEIFSNSSGINHTYSTSPIRDNRVYGNTLYGIYSYPSAVPVTGNVVYSNAVGLMLEGTATLTGGASNNLVYANSKSGIQLTTSRSIVNNTVYQPLGDGIRLTNAPNVQIANNILQVNAGAALFVDAGSVSGLAADYDFYRTTGTGVASNWEGVAFTDRAELSYETGQELHGRVGDAQFLDEDGADNSLGFAPVPIPGTQVVQDDSAAVFAGTWGTSAVGYGGSQRTTACSTAAIDYRSATWTFSGLEANATYEFAVTWKENSSLSDQSRFFVRDPLGGNVLSRVVNQQNAPADFAADGANWKRLGNVVSVGTSLSVILDNYYYYTPYSVAADAVRLVRLTADGGVDDDFHVATTSPTIDAGDLLSVYAAEPAPNGGRINLGQTGNTPEAAVSASKLIQVLAPTDIGKVEVGTSSAIVWRNFGLPATTVPPGVNTVYDAGPLAYYRLGDPVGSPANDLSGNGLLGTYLGGVSQGVAGTAGSDGAASFDGIDDYIKLFPGFSNFSGGFTCSVWINPETVSNYGTLFDLSNGSSTDRIYLRRYSTTNQLEFSLNGSSYYTPSGTLTLSTWQHFAVTIAADKSLKIYKNGTQITSATVAAMPSAVTRTQNYLASSFDGTNSAYRWSGEIDEAAFYTRALSASEITAVANSANYGLITPSGNAKIDLYQNGSFVQPIIASTPNLNSFVWNVPAGLPTGKGYQVYVSTLDGSVVGKSDSFRVVPGGNQFYVATTGDNTNSGRLPSEPMRTVRALVNAYDLDPGDVVNVEAGSYRHVTNVIIDSSDSGVTITGPTVAAGTLPLVTIDRGNSATGNAAFEVRGGDDVTIQDLGVVGGDIGVWLPANAGTDRLTMKRMRIANNDNIGLLVDIANSDVHFDDGIISGNAYGASLYGAPDARILNSDILNSTYYGARLDGYTTAAGHKPRIDSSRIRGNGSSGIELHNAAIATDNSVYENNTGINVQYSGSLVSGNKLWGNTTAGLYNYAGDISTIFENNTSFENQSGITVDYSTATIRNNRVYGNTAQGIYSSISAPPITGNVVYSNSVGILLGGSNTGLYATANNLVYGNSNYGIQLQSPSRKVANNTVYQPVGDAIRLTNAPNATLVNNILQVAAGAALVVDNGSTSGLTADYDLYRVTGSGVLSNWEGITLTDRAELSYETGQEIHGRVGDAQFVDVDGPDNVLGYNPQIIAGSQVIQDDGAATFVGSWGTSVIGGVGGSQRTTSVSTDPLLYRSATWTFNSLDPNATYEVAVTYKEAGSNNDQARFFVRDNLGGNLVSKIVNQQQAPNDFSADGANWKRLGRVVTVGTSLTVVLDNYYYYTPYSVVADAVRIVKLSSDGGPDDNFRVATTSPTIDAGDLLGSFSSEPAPNGGRINLGHTGNTADAAISSSQFIQVFAPTDIGKIEVGQNTTVAWRNFGLPGATVPPGLNAPYDAAPLAYYRLGDPIGAPVADLGVTSQSGAYLGGVTQSVAGVAGSDGAASFDGVDDRVVLPAGFNNFTTGFTFSIWVYPTAATSYGTIFDLGTGTNADRILLRRYSTSDQLEFYNGSSNQSLYTGGGTIPLNVWQHFAVTIAADKSAKIYKNGVQIASTTFSALPNVIARSQNLLGQSVENYAWAGKLDEAAVYSRVLSGAEITALSNSANYGTIAPVGNAKLDLYQSGSFVQSISAGTPNLGSFVWSVPPGLPPGQNYQVQVSTFYGTVLAKSDSFRVVPTGNQFYVSTTGDNTNSGRLPGEPMRTLRALVGVYDLDAGDVVNVAAGTYRHLTNVLLDSTDSGVTIIGPTVATGTPPLATIDRGNTTTNNAPFEIRGGDDVTIQNLGGNGGYYGVWVPAQSGTDRLTMTRMRLTGNSNTGLSAENGNTAIHFDDSAVSGSVYGVTFYRVSDGRVSNSEVFGNSNTGVNLDGNGLSGVNRPRVVNSFIHDNGSYGVYASSEVVITGNTVAKNGQYGVLAYYGTPDISGNNISGHTTYGIQVYNGNAVVLNNSVFANTNGINAVYSTPVISANRVYGNSAAGIKIEVTSQSPVRGNFVYSNSIGIDYASGTAGTIENNLVYANTNIGIRVTGSGRFLNNNTAYQPVGDAIRLENASNSELRNNIAWSDAGYAVYVDSASKTGFNSNSNLFHQGPGANAYLGYWGGTTLDTLAAWQGATGQDGSSVEGNPLFVDRDGADNVLGYVATGGGYDGGADDIFTPAASSPVIDRAELFTAPLADITGAGRVDDPATPNLGKDYTETALGASGFAATGTAQNWNSSNNYWNLNLPFNFPFYDSTYSAVQVTSEGLLYFAGPMNIYDDTNTGAELQANRIIAPLWDNLRTDLAGDNIFIDNTIANQTTIRWNASNQIDNSDVNFSVTLYSTGEIRFHYGPGNTGLTPTIGISRGDGIFVRESAISNSSTLTNANSRQFNLAFSASGFADIGAYEFRGNSLDTIPPRILATNPAGIHASGSVNTLVPSIDLTTSEPLNPISALALAAYQLRGAGANNTLGDGDDPIFALTPAYTIGSTTVTLGINSGNLAPGLYRFTASNLFDLSGNNLDGDGNGTGGDPYTRDFTIANPGITVAPTTLTTNESGTSAQFSVVLLTQPSADVVISLTNTDTTEGSLNKTSLTFTTANWNIAQFVTVTGVDDALTDGDIVYSIQTNPAISTDPRYSGFNAADVSVTNQDNEGGTPVVTGFVVNDGAAQRSRLTKIVVNFASPVNAALFQALGAVTLTRTGIPTNNLGTVGTVVNTGNGLQISPASGSVASITLTFDNVLNSGVENGSLSDGRWQLAVNPASYTSPNGPADVQLRRLFGNVNNDTLVDASDFAFFPTFGAAANNPFDWNANSDIDAATDFAQFGNRFGFTLL